MVKNALKKIKLGVKNWKGGDAISDNASRLSEMIFRLKLNEMNQTWKNLGKEFPEIGHICCETGMSL